MKTQAFFGSLFLCIAALICSVTYAQNNSALPQRQALVLAVEGKAEYSMDGKDFKRLKSGQVLKENTVVRTGSSGRVDLFFRRIGTTIRIVGDSELHMARLVQTWKEDVVVKDTLLDLRKGRMFCFVRVLVPDSKFAVKTALATTMVDGAGTGRYDIRADGTFVAGKSSRNKLKVINENGTNFIAPGQVFKVREKKMLPLEPSEQEVLVIQLDELQALAEELTPPPTADELPKGSQKQGSQTSSSK